jgi:hypothetical protein
MYYKHQFVPTSEKIFWQEITLIPPLNKEFKVRKLLHRSDNSIRLVLILHLPQFNFFPLIL